MLDLTTQSIGHDYVLFGWYDGGTEIQLMGHGKGREIGEELRSAGGSYKIIRLFYCQNDTWIAVARR